MGPNPNRVGNILLPLFSYMNTSNKPILIASDIEYYSVIWEYISRTEKRFNLV